jgi:hypothetical protein
MVYAEGTTRTSNIQYRFKITEIYWFLLTVQKKQATVTRINHLEFSECPNWRILSAKIEKGDPPPNRLSALLQLTFRITNNPASGQLTADVKNQSYYRNV